MNENHVLRFPLEIILIIVKELVDIDAFDAIIALAKMKNPFIQSALNKYILTIVFEDVLFDYYKDFFKINQFKPDYTISERKIKVNKTEAESEQDLERINSYDIASESHLNIDKEKIKKPMRYRFDDSYAAGPPKERDDYSCTGIRADQYFYENIEDFQVISKNYKMIHFEIYSMNSAKTCLSCDLQRVHAWIVNHFGYYLLSPISERTGKYLHLSLFKPIHGDMGETVLYSKVYHWELDKFYRLYGRLEQCTIFDETIETELRVEHDCNELSIYCPAKRRQWTYPYCLNSPSSSVLEYGYRNGLITGQLDENTVCFLLHKINSFIKTIDVITFTPDRNLSLTNTNCTYNSIDKLESALKSIQSYYSRVPPRIVDYYRNNNDYFIAQDKAKLIMRIITNYISLNRQNRDHITDTSTKEDNTAYYQRARFRVHDVKCFQSHCTSIRWGYIPGLRSASVHISLY